jgi:hypothetical protein
MKTSIWVKSVYAVIVLFTLSSALCAATQQEIESALEKARRDLNISMAMEERISAEMAKFKSSGAETQDVINDYELYLSLVKAMVAEKRKVVAEMESLSAMRDVRKASEKTARRDDAKAMVDPAIPEEQVVDEVAMLDRQLDSSLAEFDAIVLKELDLIRAKSSERMGDLADEAAAAAERLRQKGIDIDGDSEEKTAEPGGDSSEEQKKAEADEAALETGKETKPVEGTDDTDLTVREKSPEGIEGSKSHPRNRYDPKDDDIVARQLREAAEEETDPELREKLWKEYEQYKKNTGT